MKFDSTLNQLNEIDVTEVFRKICGEKVGIAPHGLNISINPCPKCGHNDCCKINSESNTAACYSVCNRKYMDTVQTVEWLLGVDKKGAILWLAESFKIELPQEFEQEIELLKKEMRQRLLMKRFAELCHQDMTLPDRMHWIDRGMTDKTIDDLQIGICKYDVSLYERLIAEDFSEEELKASSLFNWEHPYFAMWSTEETFPYYTLPNWSKGNVMDIQGRLAVKTENKEIPRYRTMYGRVESLYNPDAIKENVLFIAEGIPDTMSLMQMGFKAVGAYGAGAVKAEWIPTLQKDKRLYIIFDNDDKGRESAYKLAKSVGVTAKIVTLPSEVNDVNELLVCLGTDEARKKIEELMKDAVTYLQMDIGNLTSDPMGVTESQMRYLVGELVKLPPMFKDDYIEITAKHFGKNKRFIQGNIKHYQPMQVNVGEVKQGNILMIKDPRSYRLAQCFVDGKVYYAQDFMEEIVIDGRSRRFYRCRILSSERKRMEPPKPPKDMMSEELIEWVDGDTKILLKRPIDKSTRRWTKIGTPYSIDQFLKGEEPKINALELFKDIEATFRKYYYTNEDYDYAILTLFTMFTYYYEVYDAVPYLYLNGPAGSGKSSICQLLKELCFNGELVANISTAALYRQSEKLQMTLILDEQEGISSKKANDEKGDYLSVIKDAYKRTGSIQRQNPSNPEITDEFNVFSPIVIANIMGLESVVKTRTIHIGTKHAPESVVKKLSTVRPTDAEFIAETELLRDKLYCWVMQNHKDLIKLPEFDIKEVLQNRAMEIFQPIMSLAAYVDSYDSTRSYSVSKRIRESVDSKLLKRDSDKAKDTGELLREACLMVLRKKGVVKEGQKTVVNAFEILDALVELNGSREDYMKLPWIGEKIVNNGWIKSKMDRKRLFIDTKRRDPRTGLVLPNTLETVKLRVMCYNLRYELLIGG